MSELMIGEIPVSQLVKQYQTPLYVYDEKQMVENIKAFKQGFQSDHFKTKILYASKAFQTVAMLKLIQSQGLGLDVVSGGEIYEHIHCFLIFYSLVLYLYKKMYECTFFY